jgi:16S rRNA (uracil1498-N3)-methyltransferase
MSERFFLEQPICNAVTATLVNAEAHHLIKVMRAKIGDTLTLFDGSGAEYLGRVSSLSRSSVEVTIEQRSEVNREPQRELILAAALPKGDRQKVLLEKIVELGVKNFIPLQTSRGVAEAGTQVIERLQRQVIEASKQCGRNTLMQIAPALSLENLVSSRPGMLLHPHGETWNGCNVNQEQLCVAIGPEGGFTEQEIAAGQKAGWPLLSLGNRILRVETAAIAIAARYLI